MKRSNTTRPVLARHDLEPHVPHASAHPEAHDRVASRGTDVLVPVTHVLRVRHVHGIDHLEVLPLGERDPRVAADDGVVVETVGGLKVSQRACRSRSEDAVDRDLLAVAHGSVDEDLDRRHGWESIALSQEWVQGTLPIVFAHRQANGALP